MDSASGERDRHCLPGRPAGPENGGISASRFVRCDQEVHGTGGGRINGPSIRHSSRSYGDGSNTKEIMPALFSYISYSGSKSAGLANCQSHQLLCVQCYARYSNPQSLSFLIC